jgi:hypothetical protein
MLERNLAAMQISLNLSQARERLRQLRSRAGLAAQVDSLDESPPCIGQPILSSCLRRLS